MNKLQKLSTFQPSRLPQCERPSFVEQGLEVALQRKKPEREYQHALDGEGEAHLIALACSQPPTGRKHWSLRLLQNRFVKLGHADSISYETSDVK